MWGIKPIVEPSEGDSVVKFGKSYPVLQQCTAYFCNEYLNTRPVVYSFRVLMIYVIRDESVEGHTSAVPPIKGW